MSQVEHGEWLKYKATSARLARDEAAKIGATQAAVYLNGRRSAFQEAYTDYTGIEIEE